MFIGFNRVCNSLSQYSHSKKYTETYYINYGIGEFHEKLKVISCMLCITNDYGGSILLKTEPSNSLSKAMKESFSSNSYKDKFDLIKITVKGTTCFYNCIFTYFTFYDDSDVLDIHIRFDKISKIFKN